jgi:sodium-dependent dicarboxylate transporter 2/3/5
MTENSRPDSLAPVIGSDVALTAPDPGSHEPSTRRKVMVLLGAAAVMLFIYFLPEPAPLERGGNIIPLTIAGKPCLAVMAFAVILWVTETLPFAATGLMILLLLPAFGVTDFRALVRAGFGDAVIAFFIGVLICL